MLTNDPPTGTEIRFLVQMRKANVNDIGKLTKSFGPYYPERPTDKFEVDFGGERMTVERKDIVEVTRFRSA